tara:strand:+ start:3286 stop:4014 length:729 start_codon:yes stop_codon:yes gene_type:complete
LNLLVLGASSDIAKECSIVFGKNGFSLSLVCRDPQNLVNFSKNLKNRYEIDNKLYKFDILKKTNHNKLINSLTEIPDGVICFIGYYGNNKLALNDHIERKLIIDSNYTSIIEFLSTISNLFIERKNGFIIAVSSLAGIRGRQNNYYYGSSKAGLTNFLSGLRNYLWNYRINVHTVLPGYVETKMIKDLNLPKIIVTKPNVVAVDIYKGWQKKKDIIYTPFYWRFIIYIVQLIPENLFKRINW